MDSGEVFYQSVCAEIGRLRDEQWKLAYYFISVSLGIIYVFFSSDADLEFIRRNSIRWIASIMQACAIVMFVYHILRTHSYLTLHRKMRRDLERILGYQALTDAAGAPLMPRDWRRTGIDRFFEFNTVIIPLLSFVVSLQVFAIWLIWQTC